MISKRIKALTVLTAMMLSTSGASAAVVPFNEPAGSQARQIVNVIFSDYISARTGIQIGVSVVDVDKDGTGEVIARFVHSGSCKPGMEECRTVVLKYDPARDWKIVLDRMTKSMDVKTENQTGRGTADIQTDNVTWSWTYPSYRPVISSLGSEIEFKSLPGDLVAQIAPAFGAGAAKLAANHGQITFDYAEPTLAEGKKAILVRMSGLNACGDLTGCPLRLLLQNEKSWTPVMATSAEPDVLLSPINRGGYRDIVLTTKTGAVTMGWNGSSYSVSDRLEQSVVEKR